MCVYLLHFDTPYKHAKHYTGFANNLTGRLAHHANGTGARLTQVVRAAGIGWKLARVWEDADRTTERRIKNRKHAPLLCPVCNPGAMGLGHYTEKSWTPIQ
jgi:predicted GIY-YIG superfamily endonuclease